MTPNGKIKVLCSIAMIEDIVKQVSGENADTLTLVTGELDPHTYQLVKGDDEKLAFADIIFYNGLGLEHGPSLKKFLSENPKAIGLGDLINKENPEIILHYNGSVDPHIWMDINIWKKTIDYIVSALEKQDPAHASEYRERGIQLHESLTRLHEKLVNKMREVPPQKRYLVTSHDAFNYFARSYLAAENEKANHSWQERFAAPEGLAPESQLSTADIRLILEHMKKHDIHVIFPESNVSQASIRKLKNAGEESGIEIRIASEYLYGDAMGPPGSSGDSYSKMITHNVETIAKYLSNDDKKTK